MPRAFIVVAPPIHTQSRAAHVTCTLLTFAAGMVPEAPVTVQFNPAGCAATVTVKGLIKATPVGIEKRLALVATDSQSVPSVSTRPLAVRPLTVPPRVYA